MQLKRIFKYPLDLQGVLTTNLISGETYKIDAVKLPIIIAREGDFYGDTLKIKNGATGAELKTGVDFIPTCYDIEASSRAAGRACYAAFQMLKPNTAPSSIIVEYRLIGGEFTNRIAALIDNLLNVANDHRQTEWGNIKNKPTEFTPKLHNHWLSEITDWGTLIQAIRDNTQALLGLFTAMEARILRYVANLDESNRLEHIYFNSILKDLSEKEHRDRVDIDNINASLADPLKTFNMFALKDTRINGHNLHQDIHLSPEDVDAVSASRGGTFWNSFVDNRTNYGRMNSSPCITIYNKEQLDDFVPGSMIPVWKANREDGILPMPQGLGQIHKFTTHSGNHREHYSLLLTHWDGGMWYGMCTSPTWVQWSEIHTGTRPNQVLPGTITYYTGWDAPAGYAIPSGQPFDRWANPVLGAMFTNGHLPDLRGAFIRAIDHNRGLDPWGNRAIGQYQDDAMRHLTGSVYPISETFGWNGGTGTGVFHRFDKDAGGTPRKVDWSPAGGFDFDNARQVPVDRENRPVNISLNVIIKLG
jgi:hypothetical protein